MSEANISQSSLRVTLIGHSYIAPENQKNLTHLARRVALQTIAPRRYRSFTGELYGDPASPDAGSITWVEPISVKGQSLLHPFGGALARHEPDIIHAEYAPWSPLTLQTVLLAARYAPQAKLVLTLKKNTYMPKPMLLEEVKRWLFRHIDRRVAAYLVESEMTCRLAEDWLEIAQSRLHVCQQLGVDLLAFTPAAAPPSPGDGGAVVGYVGQLRPRKGVLKLVQAVRRVIAESGLQLTLRLLGAGPLQDDLRRLMHAEPWLSVEGPVAHSQVPAFLQGCDIFAFPSQNEPDHQEHDGHALMEAMACGLPAIVTKSGIISELCENGTAVFVRERSTEDLAKALRTVTADPRMRLEMGRRARAVAERRFGLPHLADKRLAVYNEVAHG